MTAKKKYVTRKVNRAVPKRTHLRTIRCKSREQWLDARRCQIQASEVGAIFGVGYANQNAASVWYAKRHGEVEVDEETQELFDIGLIMQPAILNVFRYVTKLEVIDPVEHELRTNQQYPLLGASLDGQVINSDFSSEPLPLEVKNVSAHQAHEWRDGHIPLKYQVQCQVQMACTDSPAAAIIGLIGGSRPLMSWLTRDDGFLDAAMPRLDEFWQAYKAGVLPDLDERPFVTKRVLDLLYGADSGLAVELPDEAGAWIAARDWATKHAKICKEVAERASNHIRVAIGEDSFGVYGDRVFSNKQTVREERTRVVNVKAATFRTLREVKSLPKDVTVKAIAPPVEGAEPLLEERVRNDNDSTSES